MLVQVLFLVLLLLSARVSQAASGTACPNCDLYDPALPGSSYTCKSETRYSGPISGGTRVCVGIAGNLQSCDNAKRPVSPPTPNGAVTNPQTDVENCGSCGNKCPDEASFCEDGKCICRVGFFCGPTNRTLFCEESSKKCKSCPVGRANCFNSIADAGTSADCETNISNDPQNCGACDRQCPTGQACVNGECQCNSASCAYPLDLCINNKCKECDTFDNTGSELTKCMKLSIDHDSRFCNRSSLCGTCPTGFGDCLPTNVDGDPDDGTTKDCETNFAAVNGQTEVCGTCRSACNGHDSMSCCKGSCKCGKFANPLIPTTNECAAAATCKTSEYCDEKTGLCLPLLFGKEDCRGTASLPTDVDPAWRDSTDGFCGSCVRNISDLNYVNFTCQASNNEQCGATGETCRPGQTCIQGKCHCVDTVTFLLDSWQPYLDNDPDRDNKFSIETMPQSGCNPILLTSVRNHAFSRARQTLFRFVSCMDRSSSKHSEEQLTLDKMRDGEFRKKVCPGGTDLCPTQFCDELERNFTGNDRNFLCGAVNEASARLKSCAQNFRFAGNDQGDLTCANWLALHETETPNTFTYLDLYNFLECDGAKPNMSLPMDPSDYPTIFPNRVATGMFLLGASSNLVVSMFMVCLVVGVSILLVTF